MRSEGGSNPWAGFAPHLLASTLPFHAREHIGATVGATVADLGCGLGGACMLLAKQGTRAVVGVDINEEALSLARRRSENASHFILADVRCLPLANQTVDIALAQALLTTLSDLPDRTLCLSEVSRILVPGGRLWITDFSQNWHLDHYRRRYLLGIEAGEDVGTFAVMDDMTGQVLFRAHHYEERELTELLLTAGLVLEQFEYQHVRTWHDNRVYGIVATARRPAAAERVERPLRGDA